MRSVTRVAIKEARSHEITDQMARSDRLKVSLYAELTAALIYQLQGLRSFSNLDHLDLSDEIDPVR